VAGCCRSARWPPERPKGRAWQPPLPHHTQTPPWSDALSPATRPPCPRPARKQPSESAV
jgi:hypothetical protein